MWKWIKTDVLPLTKELALEVASLPHFEGDRPWDSGSGKQRMQWLSRICDEGKFYPPRWATTDFNGMTYRVNGGTSSHMLVSRNGHFPSGLSVLVDRFVCETREDVADLFDQFDHRKSIRTLIQKVRAHKPAEEQLAAVSPTDINACLRGVGSSIQGFTKIEEDVKVGLMHQYAGFVAWAAPYARRQHLNNSGVMAAIFDSYNSDAIYAKGFWDHVANESHPDTTHPTRILASFLKDRLRKGRKSEFTSLEIHTKCAHAWNAARRGGTTALKLYKREGRATFN